MLNFVDMVDNVVNESSAGDRLKRDIRKIKALGKTGGKALKQGVIGRTMRLSGGNFVKLKKTISKGVKKQRAIKQGRIAKRTQAKRVIGRRLGATKNLAIKAMKAREKKKLVQRLGGAKKVAGSGLSI